ncbi:MAG: DUF86 domain-containing protein [Peptococcaceae bacterium]|nr:DUF86 domain-containing protein [Peptococcaceae bacterium]
MENNRIIEKMIFLIERIESYSQGMSYEKFVTNSMVVDACVFNLSQLGELAGKIDDAFEENNPQIPWRQIYGLRNRIVHDYEGVNLKLVWEIIETDLPDLKNELELL